MDPIEQFLNRLHHPTLASIDMSLARMQRLLLMLGSPERRLPPVLHIAGTNGKGSVLAYLRSILQKAGYRVHRYTSPHLVHFRERVEVQGEEISNSQIESIIRYMAPKLAEQPATFFEATTALAFLAFADKPADILLLETGLGGRLDATNVISQPMLTAITPISFDHMEYLGNSLTAIASEKAGIIKRGVPVVIGKQETEVRALLEAKADEMGALVYRFGQEWTVEAGRYRSAQRDMALKPSLEGAFQIDNAAMAVACLEQMPHFSVSDAQIEEGLATTHWPARLQPLTDGRLKKLLPAQTELWLDGGHNAVGGQMLADWLKAKNLPVYLVCGMIKGKDGAEFLRPIAPYVQQLHGVLIRDESNSQSAASVCAAAQSVGMTAQPADSIEKALQTIATHVTKPSIVCICGSLYLAGKALAANKE